MDLVRAYARDNSESGFAGLVDRHIPLVHFVALRFTGNAEDAQDGHCSDGRNWGAPALCRSRRLLPVSDARGEQVRCPDQ